MNASELRVVAALASVLLNVPWLILVGVVLQMYEKATGPIAGEVWLLPLMVWMITAPLAVVSGCAAIVRMRGPIGQRRVKWIAFLGIALAATVPAFGVVYRVTEALR